MTAWVLGVIALALILYFASGAWSARVRRRGPQCEADVRRAELWAQQSREHEPGADPLVAALDLALRDGCDCEEDEFRLPPNDTKG